jgi:pilus assembly protein Flp/PilA
MKPFASFLSSFLRDTGGATAVEYAMIAVLVGLAVVGGATALGQAVAAKFQGVSTSFSAAVNP